MKKCCVKCCANDRMVDPEKFRSKMVTVKELSLDSFKHLPLETWALEPENTYKGANDKVFPRACQNHLLQAFKKKGKNAMRKSNRVGGSARSPVILILVVLLTKQKARKAAVAV